MAEGSGLLNRRTIYSRTGGSNPPLSASLAWIFFSLRSFFPFRFLCSIPQYLQHSACQKSEISKALLSLQITSIFSIFGYILLIFVSNLHFNRTIFKKVRLKKSKAYNTCLQKVRVAWEEKSLILTLKKSGILLHIC